MGNWNINIQGIGPHHNRGKLDADALAAKLVEELARAGHFVEWATFTYGAKEDLHPEITGVRLKEK